MLILDPSLAEQQHKAGSVLRVETVINEPALILQIG